jgi:hypothetical protein
MKVVIEQDDQLIEHVMKAHNLSRDRVIDDLFLMARESLRNPLEDTK